MEILVYRTAAGGPSRGVCSSPLTFEDIPARSAGPWNIPMTAKELRLCFTGPRSRRYPQIQLRFSDKA